MLQLLNNSTCKHPSTRNEMSCLLSTELCGVYVQMELKGQHQFKNQIKKESKLTSRVKKI